MMRNMTDPLAALIPTPYEDYESGSTADYTADYTDISNSLCDKSNVRNFRRQYEPPLYWLIVILGSVGNLLVIWIYTQFKNRLKTMTDVYLLNLAVADLLFLCTLPFWATDAVNGWTFGTLMCKGVSALYKINFFSCMLLLTCISVDRYFMIVLTTKAHNSKGNLLTCSKLTCVIVWLLAIVLAVPEFLFARSKEDMDNNKYCAMVYWYNENNRTKITVLVLQICVGFCIPLLVMVYCYALIIHTLLKAKSFEKHKALRVVLAVVAVFVLSQLPYNSMLVFEASQAVNTTITDCNQAQGFDVATQVLKSLAYTHCCLNPVLYVFVGVRFRKDLRRLFHTFLPRSSKGVKQRSSVMMDAESTTAFSL
ncbi:C-C chemokine receptor type 9a [Brachyhypopomus gauderio]|uniref:C-C chemokine receptor type 9a n=1 Tax=Brachyhypopomus gauderio TaxID=698409 RepID=UPI0040415B8E